ncbi:MAG: cation-translocating P-type ATPase C-terminal domain-containing protein [Ignavibacteria bacterium]
MAIRSDYELLYKRGIFSNLPLFGACVTDIVLQLMVIYLPAANKVFKTNPLSMTDLVICLLLYGRVSCSRTGKIHKEKSDKENSS